MKISFSLVTDDGAHELRIDRIVQEEMLRRIESPGLILKSELERMFLEFARVAKDFGDTYKQPK